MTANTQSAKLARGVVSGLLARGVAILAPIVSVPMLLGYLENDLYGLVIAVQSFTAVLVFADLGLGNGILTLLGASVGRNDFDGARRIVTAAYGGLGCVSALLAFLATAAVASGRLPPIMRMPSSVAGASTSVIAWVCLMGFILNIASGLILKIQYAAGRIAQANNLQAAGAVSMLPILWLAIRGDSGSYVVVAVATWFPAITNAVITFIFFRGAGQGIRPGVRYFDWGSVRKLTGMGSAFLLLNVLMGITAGLDSYLIGAFLGVGAVAGYALPARLFAQVAQVTAMLNMPLWAAHANAAARQDAIWIQRITVRMCLISGATVALVGGILALFGNDVVQLWTKSELDASLCYWTGLAVLGLLQAVLSPLFMLQNAVGLLRPQLICWTICCPVTLVAKVGLLPYVGADWMPWIAAFLYATICAPACVLGYRTAFRKVKNGTTHAL